MQVDAVAKSAVVNSIEGGIVNPSMGSVELPVQKKRIFPRLIGGLLPAVNNNLKKTRYQTSAVHIVTVVN